MIRSYIRNIIVGEIVFSLAEEARMNIPEWFKPGLTGAAETNRRPTALHNTQQRKTNKTIVVNRSIEKQLE